MALWKQDGYDGVIRRARVTHFGDPTDLEDNGVGAWGFEYRKRSDFPGVALPIPFVKKHKLREYHPVKVYNPVNQRVIYCFLIDLGPSASLNRDADLLIWPWQFLGFQIGPDDPGEVLVDIRIPYLYGKPETLDE